MRVMNRRVPSDRRTTSAAVAARQPWRRISAEMVRRLLAALDGEPPAAVILPTELVRRASA